VKKIISPAGIILVGILCLTALTACDGNELDGTSTAIGTQDQRPTNQTAEADFRAPTVVTEKTSAPPLPSPTVAANPTLIEIIQPTATLICADGLYFIEDLSIPDGTEVTPGEIIDKRWLVKNSGTCNWNNKYQLKLVEGNNLGAANEIALYPAVSGAPAIIRIIYTAPAEPGVYQSAWQAQNEQGQLFGDIIYIDIRVVE